MAIRYILETEIDAVINEDLFSNIKLDDSVLLKVKLLISEFERNKKCVKAFFETYIIDEYFDESGKGYDVLCEKLGYSKEYKSIFLEVAENSASDIRKDMIEFVTWMYENINEDNPEIKIREKVRYILESKMPSTVILNANLVEV